MPIYEYECTNCGHRFDAFQKISDTPLRDCPECNKPDLRKCVTAAAFQLKGTGWYETDFKDKKKPDANPAQKKDKKDSSTKTSESGSSDSGSKKTVTNDKTSG